MYNRYISVLLFWLMSIALVGCSTAPAVNKEAARITAATQFIQNIGIGELMVKALAKEFEKRSAEQPGLANFMKRAFADFDREYFEGMVAKIYAKHLVYDELSELASLSEKPTIKTFFRLIFNNVLSGKPLDKPALLNNFDADGIEDIMQLGVSDSFIRLKEVLPVINAELAQNARAIAIEKMKEYLESRELRI